MGETRVVNAADGWSKLKLSVVFTGLAVAGLAMILIYWASPSPHGYIEAFFGVPLLLIGLIGSGLGIVLQGKPFSWLLRAWGWLTLFAGLGLLTWMAVSVFSALG